MSAPSALDLLALSPPGWGGVLLRGLRASIEIAAGGFGLGVLIGFGGAVGKLYGGPVARDLLGVYTTIVRAVPELVLIVLLYYAGTDALNSAFSALGLASVDISGFVAGVLVIGFVQGAYATEVLRGAIQAVPSGQVEAGRCFGMPGRTVFRRITVPAMLPHALPGLSNLWLVTTKDTALLAVVGFSELTLVTRQAAGGTKAYFLFYCAAGLLYLGVTLLSNLGLRALSFRQRRWMPSFR